MWRNSKQLIIFSLIWCWLGAVRLVVLALPLRWLLKCLGDVQAVNVQLPSDIDVWRARRVMCFIARVSPYVPWRCVCMEKAVALKWLLNVLQIPSTFCLGLNRDEGLKAHAWVICGEQQFNQAGDYTAVCAVG